MQELVDPIIDNAKHKLKWTLPLHWQVRNMYTNNLVLKRRLGLVKQQLTEAKQYRRKRKRGKLDILAEVEKKKFHQVDAIEF